MSRTIHARSGRQDVPINEPSQPPPERTEEPRFGANIVRLTSAADAKGRVAQRVQEQEIAVEVNVLPRHNEHENLKPASEEPDAERIQERDRKTLEQAAKDAPLEPTKEAVPDTIPEAGKPPASKSVVAPSPVRRPTVKPKSDPSRTTRQQRIARSRR